MMTNPNMLLEPPSLEPIELELLALKELAHPANLPTELLFIGAWAVGKAIESAVTEEL